MTDDDRPRCVHCRVLLLGRRCPQCGEDRITHADFDAARQALLEAGARLAGRPVNPEGTAR